MSYSRTSYRRGHRPGTTLRTGTPGRVARPNKRAGECRSCHAEIPAYGGHLWREDDGTWSVVHIPRDWFGSPVSGLYVGGCPAETDRMNAGCNVPEPGSEADRINQRAALAARMARRNDPGKYAYTSTGARMTASSRRCEDAPCCGCCD